MRRAHTDLFLLAWEKISQPVLIWEYKSAREFGLYRLWRAQVFHVRTIRSGNCHARGTFKGCSIPDKEWRVLYSTKTFASFPTRGVPGKTVPRYFTVRYGKILICQNTVFYHKVPFFTIRCRFLPWTAVLFCMCEKMPEIIVFPCQNRSIWS
jgi:hypothetical protein